MKYTEIFRLKAMLKKAGIPFMFIAHKDYRNGFQICYPDAENMVCSVIEHKFSYGNEKDLLEIQGLLTIKEMDESYDSVLGYLTADDVFRRIKEHHQNEKRNGNKPSEGCWPDDETS